MKQLFILIALAFVMNAGAQTMAVEVKRGVYGPKLRNGNPKYSVWRYAKPVSINTLVVFDYPNVTVGDCTYKLTENVGDTTTSTYDLYVSRCVDNTNSVGLLSIIIYKDGSYYLSIRYGNVMKIYTLKSNYYEMGNNS